MIMARRRLLYLHKQITRHGKVIWYVRRGHGRRIRIYGDYNSQEFIKEYHAAISGNPVIKPRTVEKHTLEWLISRYRQSAIWELSSPATKKQRDNFYYNIISSSGNVPYKAVKRSDILTAIDNRRSTPGAANNFLKSVKALFKWAKDAGYIDYDPTEGVKKLQYQSKGFPAWNILDVSKFREFWPIGSRERLAMEILLWTGLRRSDVVRLGKQHIKNGMALLVAEKTKEQLYITIPPDLQILIDNSPTGDLALISTESGNPRNKDAFGNWFRGICNKAGVTKSAHGLRKLAASLLAEAGGTEKELQAVFGWKSDRQSQLYTRGADRKHLAIQASKKRGNVNPIPSPIVKVRE